MSSTPRHRAGFTIIELLVVMALIALLSGIGVGMMRRRDSNLTTEINGRLLRSVLREARNSAKLGGAGVLVRLNREENTIEASPLQLAGNWHFEDQFGSRRLAIPDALDLVEEGWMGRAVRLSDNQIDLGRQPFFQATEGFRLRFWVKADAGARGTLFARPGSWKMSLTDEGALEGEIFVEPQGESVQVKTRPGLLTSGWHRLSMTYDRLELILEVDGVRYGVRKEHRVLAVEPRAHLLLGGSGFKGLVDEVRLDVALSGKVEEFSVGTDILEEGDTLIRFDGHGRLDRRFHTKPALVILQGDAPNDESEPIREEVRIEFSGVIR